MPSHSAEVVLYDVAKAYGDVQAVRGVSLQVEPGSFVSLLGPSGCGKTTLLRLVGGFETPDAGTVQIGGKDVTRMAPQARPTAMVFQSYALFPTMTVAENVGYGLKVRGEQSRSIKEKVGEALERVRLGGYSHRPVSALSGGQQQRVALARAIAVEPAVLLFDEPLSNLDLALREATRAELKSLQNDLGITSIYVTHDQTEALALSDKVAVMQEGQIVEVGNPEELYKTPETAFVAGFLGGSNVITSEEVIRAFVNEVTPSGKALAIRPEAFDVAEQGVEVVPISHQFLGTHRELIVSIHQERLRVWIPSEMPVPERLFIRCASHRWVRLDA